MDDKHSEIKDPYSIPDEIVKAIETKQLIIFVGAGISSLCGLKRWDELSDELIDGCYFSDCIGLYERDQYKRLSDPKEKISLAFSAYCSKSKTHLFYKHIEKSMNNCSLDKTCEKELKFLDETQIKNKNAEEIFKFIKSSFSSVITTNVDKILDEECFDNNYNLIHFNKDDFSKLMTNSTPSIAHIHGSIDDIDNIVFTIPQYAELYSDKAFQDFIDYIFQHKTVLFIGYGLRELELLIHIGNKNKVKHFALMPYNTYNKITENTYSTLFKLLNIQQIPYYVGQNDYKVLNDILGEWNKQLDQTRIPGDINSQLYEYAHNMPSEDSINYIHLTFKRNMYYNQFLSYLLESKFAVQWIINIFYLTFYDKDNQKLYDIVITETYNWYPLTVFSTIFENNSENTFLISLSNKVLDAMSTHDFIESHGNKQLAITNYLHIISYMGDNGITCNNVGFLKNIEKCDSLDVYYLTNKKSKINMWPDYAKEIVFNIIIKYFENDKGTWDMDSFIKNHLTSFCKNIPRYIFHYVCNKINSILELYKYRFLDMGSISVYPDHHGKIYSIHNYEGLLIDCIRQSALNLSLQDKVQFINTVKKENTMMVRIAFFVISSTSKLHHIVLEKSDEYVGPRSTFSELYHWFYKHSDNIEYDIAEKLFLKIEKTSFEKPCDNYKQVLLYLLSCRLSKTNNYDSKDLDTIKEIIQRGDPYNISKLVSAHPIDDLAPKENELVNQLSNKDTEELIDIINSGKGIPPLFNNDYIKNKIIHAHLSRTPVEKIFNDIELYQRIIPEYRSSVAIEISNYHKKNKLNRVPDPVVSYLLNNINDCEKELVGYAAISTLSDILQVLTDVQIIKITDSLLAKRDIIPMSQMRWTINSFIDYYKQYWKTLFLISFECYSRKLHQYTEKIMQSIINELKDDCNWQIRQIIYWLKHYRLLNEKIYYTFENEYFLLLLNVNEKIQMPCLSEMIVNSCIHPKFIDSLTNMGYIDLLNKHHMDDNSRNEIKERWGVIVAYILDKNLIKQETEMVKAFCDRLDGYLISGYLYYAVNNTISDRMVVSSVVILNGIDTTDPDSSTIKNCDLRALCTFYISYNVDEVNWSLIRSCCERYPYIFLDELNTLFMKHIVNDKYVSEILEILIVITGGPVHYNESNTDCLVSIFDAIDNKYLKMKNKIINNLLKNGHHDIVERINGRKK